MKKQLKYIIPAIILGLGFSSCEVPEYPSDMAVEPGTVNGVFAGKAVTCTIDGETVVVEPVDAVLTSSFVRGFDASAVNDTGAGDYFDEKGVKKDVFVILRQYGINWVRLRVWNNPDSLKNPDYPGASDKTTVVKQAVRAKKAGLKVLLDFHYSDYWADPGQQLIPEAWLSAATAEEMAEKVYGWTKEVLEAMSASQAVPDMIQIGNEINSGILVHKAISGSTKTAADEAVSGKNGSDNFITYLKAGIKASRDVCPSAKIMLHLAGGGKNLDSYLNNFKNNNLDYDVFGLSWYPEESSHGTIAALASNITHIKNDFGKEVIVAETNIHYKNDSSTATATATANLKSGGKLYSGILSDSNGSVELSLQNQANVVRAVIEVTAKNGGSGVFEWGGEYKGAWNSMFNGSGKPLPSAGVFSVEGK